MSKKLICSLLLILPASLIQSQESYDIVQEAEKLKTEINMLNDQLAQEVISQELKGKKKKAILRQLEQFKLDDSVVEKFLGDNEISEKAKTKVIKELNKVKEQAQSKTKEESSEIIEE